MSAVVTFLIVAGIVIVAWVAIAFLGWALIHGAALIERGNKGPELNATTPATGYATNAPAHTSKPSTPKGHHERS